MEDKTIILDGGMGTMLQAAGLKPGYIPELLNIEDPDMVIGVHKKYIQAGSDIIYTCTFGASRLKLGDQVAPVVQKAVENATIAKGDSKVKIALDIGPLGQMLEPMGTLKFEQAYDIFQEIVLAGKDLADYIVIETMTDLYEVKAAVLAAKENSDLPILATMSFEEDGRTFAGVSLETFANAIGGLGVSGLGINCSLGPVQMESMVQKLGQITDLDLIVKPNAGLPKADGTYDLTKEDFVASMERIHKMGVKYLGGCCGTNDGHIGLLVDRLGGKQVYKRPGSKQISRPSSATKMAPDSGLLMVGERLNPSGKKAFQEALVNEDMDYIISQALGQVEGGAHVLDLNVGHPGLDEAYMQKKTTKVLQSVLDTPLMIDSTKAEALEAALRVYNGKAIVNSVNGEEKSLETILPLVKKYNAQVIGLAFDDSGIGQRAEDRLKAARKIVERAQAYSIPKEDIYIDCLSLTVASQAEGAMETLRAMAMVKEELGVKTALGVSNISYGLVKRDLINSSFITLALYQGLDLAIINTESKALMDAIRAYQVIANQPGAMEAYLETYSGQEDEKKSRSKTQDMDIETAVYKGLDNEVRSIVKDQLERRQALDIVNEDLIPALDLVGDHYQEGKIFLPQLIKSAQSAQEGFGLIRQAIASQGSESISKGDVLIATVKGDIHDIGKNIAKVILENYGYKVYDLGKDVDIDYVVDQALTRNIKLVGLSALMTTSLDNMEITIQALREKIPHVKIMVGGAVLTPDYAKTIGADYYLPDAKANVLVADEIFGVDTNDK